MMRGKRWGRLDRPSACRGGGQGSRQATHFVRRLPAGSVIRPEDIRRIRSVMGLASKHFQELLG